MKLRRRTLLTLGGLGVLALFFPQCGAILRQILFSPEGRDVPPLAPRPNPFAEDARSLVAIARGDDLAATLRQSLRLLGGIERLDVKGREVLVKPNVVAGDPPPQTTDPRLVRAVVELLYESGAKRVTVGEMSAILTLPTERNLKKTGVGPVAEAAGARVITFDEGEWVRVESPLAANAGPFFVAKAIYEAERWISLPVIKTHRSAAYSISLKNTIGCIHPRNRPSLTASRMWEEIIAEVNLGARPHLTIADGWTSMVAGGPWSGEAASTRLLLASGDQVAIDVVGLGLIKHFGKWDWVNRMRPWDQRQVRRAIEVGLGAKGPEEVAIVASTLGADPEFDRLVDGVKAHVYGQA